MTKYEIFRSFEDALIIIDDIIGDKETTNFQLLNLGQKIFGENFKDVYYSDDKITLKNGEMCIINTDSHGKPGLHWISLYKYKNVYYVFDSFGRDVHTLSKYFKYKKWQNVEFRRIESYKQANCGQLSLAWIVIFDKYKLKCIGVI